MKRRIIQRRVVVFLLLLLAGGAIVNVAVAWGSAAFSRRSLLTNDFGNPQDRLVAMQTWASSAGDLVCIKNHGFGVQDQLCFSTAGGTDFKEEHIDWNLVFQALNQRFKLIDSRRAFYLPKLANPTRLHVCAGWPMYSLDCQSISSQNSRQVDRAICYRFSLKGENLERYLPYSIMLPGFAINTIFYAAILGRCSLCRVN